MIEYLDRIYTHSGITPPDAEDIHNEVLDLLCHEEYAQKVFFQIQNEPCPYRRDALLECFRRELHSSRQLIKGHVCMEYDGCTMIVWQDAEHEIKQAIRRCRSLEDGVPPIGRSQSELKDAASGYRLEAKGERREARGERREVRGERLEARIEQVKSTIQQIVQDIAADITIGQGVSVHIDRLTIPVHIHNYNAPIGQYWHHIEQQELKQ